MATMAPVVAAKSNDERNGRGVSGQGAARVEAKPAQPENERAQRRQGDVVAANVLAEDLVASLAQ
jgi:hypothetical protein